jgi:hypothetical protein
MELSSYIFPKISRLFVPFAISFFVHSAEEDEILAAKMKFLSKEINSFKSFVEENNLERKSAKWEITEHIKDFPFLGEQELRNITCGVYQLKLSPSYIQENFKCSTKYH